MEFVQLRPTGMVWPPSVRGLLVTEPVRGDGGVLRNSEGKRFMFNYMPDLFRPQYAETEEDADRWYSYPTKRATKCAASGFIKRDCAANRRSQAA
jgi:succinate dehydrogenase / fumarate reductase flavoprotein subunit